MRIRPILKIIAAILVLVSTLICFALATWIPLGGNACPPGETERINDFIDLELPPSTRNLWANCKSIKGFIVQARFEIDPSDLDVLLQSTNIDLPLISSGKPGTLFFLDETVKLETQQVETYLYGEYQGNDWREEILIDTSESNDYIVYYVVGAG